VLGGLLGSLSSLVGPTHGQTMDSSTIRQDMPPKGGYKAFQWAKVPGKKPIGGYATFGIVGAITAAAWVGYIIEQKIKKKVIIEMNDGRMALAPLLLAEEQRAYLRQLRTNRDEENELMKNVPGWQTGTLYGEPVYQNVNQRFPVVHPEEYYIHAPYGRMNDRIFERRKH